MSPGYAAPMCQTETEACELEGLNGKVSTGRMTFFDAVAGLVHLQIPPSRGTLTLKLTQFRRLTLTRPLLPLAPPNGAAFDATSPLLPQRSLSSGTLRFKDGSQTKVESIGQVATALGLLNVLPAYRR